MKKEERIKYFIEKQEYKVLGDKKNGVAVLGLDHQNGDKTIIIVDPDGSWDVA